MEYILSQAHETDPARAAEVRRLLEWNGGGHSTGVGIAT
jgi:hypothetical protein